MRQRLPIQTEDNPEFMALVNDRATTLMNNGGTLTETTGLPSSINPQAVDRLHEISRREASKLEAKLGGFLLGISVGALLWSHVPAFSAFVKSAHEGLSQTFIN